MSSKLTNEEFLENLKKYGVKDIPLEEYKGKEKHILFQCHNNPKHTFYAAPYVMYRNKEHCPYCLRRKVFVGETDMWTTDPDLAKMLLNHEDGYKYFSTGSQCVDWVCPNCGNIINKQINQVRTSGLSCDICGDGMSFSEKFIYCMLLQLGCVFVHDRTTEWSGCKKYDFYIPDMSLIIEANGIQHYDDAFSFHDNQRSRTLEEERENDKYKLRLAVDNGIKHYIQLDCRISSLDFIKNSILNSELSTLFDLSCVDWNECMYFTFKSTTILCGELWNSGMKSTKKISEKTGIHISSVISKLKHCAQIGMCDYTPYCERSKPIMCIETGKIYNRPKDVERYGYHYPSVLQVCKGKLQTSGGFHWAYV